MSLRARLSLRKQMSLRSNSAILSTDAGSGIVLILMLMAVASISMMGAISLGGVQQKTRTQNMLPYHVELWRGNILSILSSTVNFNQTATDSHNPNMGCVTDNHIACPASNEQIYNVRTVVDTGTPSYTLGGMNGITPSGQTCLDYPSETCPIRFNVFWICTSGCTASPPPLYPLIVRTYSIQITPEYNPNPTGAANSKSQVAFDVSKYALDNVIVGATFAPSALYVKP